MPPRAVVLPPTPRLVDVCSPACRRLLGQRLDPVWNDLGRDYRADELAALLPGAEVLLTSWGSPPLTEEHLRVAADLRAVAHAAGSVRRLLPRSALDRGVAVFSAAPRIAESVAEYCLAATLTLLRRLPMLHARMRAGGWRADGLRGRELRGSDVGIVSASATARAFLRLLAPFGVRARIYDPYLSEPHAARLGGVKASLEEAMGCRVVSLHAPGIPATRGLVTRELLRLVPDGAVLVNSSRGAVVDQDALIDELLAGRLLAALDVFAEEPLPDGHPLRGLDNVLLSPHVAGDTVEGHQALMEEVVVDLLAHLDGVGGGRTRVDPRAWERMA